MSREKTERLLNLTLALLGTRTFLTKSQILATVQGYAGTPEAVDRMFERDKDDLREMGIPLEVRPIDPLFEDEPGYRIDRRAYEMPAMHFTAKEMAWLSVAAQAWQRAALAGPAAEGLRKLIASGAEPDESTMESLHASMTTQEGAFTPIWEAVRDRVAIRFSYRSAGSREEQERHVDPWGLLSTSGRWYLVGHDHDRDQVRVFRLSRISSAPKAAGRPGGFQVPEDVDLWSHVALLEVPANHRYDATVRVRTGRGHALRRRASEDGPAGDGWDRITFPVIDTDVAARQIAALGPVIVVESPQELRDAVITLLTSAVTSHG